MQQLRQSKIVLLKTRFRCDIIITQRIALKLNNAPRIPVSKPILKLNGIWPAVKNDWPTSDSDWPVKLFQS